MTLFIMSSLEKNEGFSICCFWTTITNSPLSNTSLIISSYVPRYIVSLIFVNSLQTTKYGLLKISLISFNDCLILWTDSKNTIGTLIELSSFNFSILWFLLAGKKPLK